MQFIFSISLQRCEKIPVFWSPLLFCASEKNNKTVHYVNIENEDFQSREIGFTNVIQMKTRSWTIQCTSCFFSALVSTFLLFNSKLKTMMHAVCLLIMKCNIYRLKQKWIPESLHWKTSFCESNRDVSSFASFTSMPLQIPYCFYLC